MTGSYFHNANVGHLLKSRAAENHIFYNRLTDEIGGTASYELEFPNGGLTYNTIVDDSAKGGFFLNHKTGLDKLQAANDKAELLTDNNLTTGWESFVQASRYNYQPKGSEIAQFKTTPLAPANGTRLEPQRQYLHPAQTIPLAPGPLMPGAVQTR